MDGSDDVSEETEDHRRRPCDEIFAMIEGTG